MRKAAKKSRRMKKRVSKVARGKRQKSSVFRGTKEKTSGGLKKTDLIRNRRGKVVSRKQSTAARKRAGARFTKWGQATKKQRRQLNIKGFCPVGGKTQQGRKLLAKVRSFM